MNTLSLIIILALIGIMMFLSFQNMLFAISRDVKEKIIESRIKNFVDIIETVSKISSDYFYLEYFIDQSDLKIENNTLKIKVDDKTYSFLLHSKVENVEINKASRYCIFKDRNIIKIFNCKDAIPINDGICEVRECRLNSDDCKGPNMACINDGICNTYIGENCESSADCAEKNNEKVCCPSDPNSNEKGYTARKNLKKGEECFCDSQCSNNLKCNPVASNFKEYSRACCESGKYWNGNDCVESKLKILFIPVNWNGDMRNFKEAAKKHFDFFVKNIPLSSCPEKVVDIIVEKNCRFSMICYLDDLLKIKNCADATGESYDYIVGLEDDVVCSNAVGFSCGMGTVFVTATASEIITTHELGHEFGLNDEYIDACRCGSGLVNPNSNCLKSYLGGDDPFGPYTREYCSEKGTKCPTEYTITCLGNKNKHGGRDIMSFANAPGPRAFAEEESWRYLSSLSILKC